MMTEIKKDFTQDPILEAAYLKHLLYGACDH